MYKEFDLILNVIEENKINLIYLGEGTFWNVTSQLHHNTGNENMFRQDWYLPSELEYFYSKYNGGFLLKHNTYGGGFIILSPDEIEEHINEYEIDRKGVFPIAYIEGGHICVDSSKVKEGNKNYLFWLSSYLSNDNLLDLKTDFPNWLDKMLVCQGQPYWLL